MSSPVLVDIFVKDRAHEAFLVPMLLAIPQGSVFSRTLKMGVVLADALSV